MHFARREQVGTTCHRTSKVIPTVNSSVPDGSGSALLCSLVRSHHRACLPDSFWRLSESGRGRSCSTWLAEADTWRPWRPRRGRRSRQSTSRRSMVDTATRRYPAAVFPGSLTPKLYRSRTACSTPCHRLWRSPLPVSFAGAGRGAQGIAHRRSLGLHCVGAASTSTFSRRWSSTPFARSAIRRPPFRRRLRASSATSKHACVCCANLGSSSPPPHAERLVARARRRVGTPTDRPADRWHCAHVIDHPVAAAGQDRRAHQGGRALN